MSLTTIDTQENIIEQDFTISYERSELEQKQVTGFYTMTSCKIKAVDEIEAIIKFRELHPGCIFSGMVKVEYRW